MIYLFYIIRRIIMEISLNEPIFDIIKNISREMNIENNELKIKINPI